MRLIQAAFRLFILIALLAHGHALTLMAQEPTFTVQTDHSTPVVSLAFSRDGRYMVTGSFNGEFKVWEAATRRELRSFGQRAGSLISLGISIDVSPDGQTVALSSLGKVSLWDIVTGREIKGAATGADGLSVLWDARGRLFVGDRRQFAVYDPATGGAARLGGGGSAFAVTRNGERAAVVDRGAEIWDVSAKTKILVRPRHSFSAVTFTPDGQRLLTGDDAGTIRSHGASDGEEESVFAQGQLKHARSEEEQFQEQMRGPASRIKALAFNAQGDLLASIAADGEIAVRKWPTGEQVLAVKGNEGLERMTFLSMIPPESAIRFTPDGEYLASCRGGTVEFFSLRGKEKQTPARPPEEVSYGANMQGMMKFVGPGRLYALPGGPAVRFSAGGRWLSTLGVASFLMSLASGEVTPVRRRANEMLVKLSPDEVNGIMLSSGLDLRLFNFDTEESVPLGTLPDESLLSDVSSSGRQLLSASFTGGEVRLWDLIERRQSHAWRLPAGEIPVLGNIYSPTLLSPDGKIFISQSGDNTVTLRDAASGRVVNSIKGYVGQDTGTLNGDFSPDGRVLALSARGRPVELWEVGSGRKLRTLGESTGQGATVTCLTYSPDGKFLYAMDMKFRVWAWEVESGRAVPPLNIMAAEHGEGPTPFDLFSEGMPLSISLSPDGSVLAANIFRGHTTELILTDLRRRRLLANVYVKENGDWLVKTPDGRFDTNRLENSDLLSGVFPDEPDRAVSLDLFLRDYFEPRLLPRLLSGEQLRAVRDISSLNRVQPRVSPPRIGRRDKDLYAEVAVEVLNVVGKVQKDARGRPLESGVFDVRLFRDGQIVGHSIKDEQIPAASRDSGSEADLAVWREASRVRLDGDKARVTFRVKLPAGPAGRKVEFSAYAFNSDRVKSETARSEYVIPSGPAAAPAPRRAYVVAVGVNRYQNPAWNLRFAANDARLTLRLLSEQLRAVNEYSEVIEIPLISDNELAHGQAAPPEATKANIRGVFDLLAGRKVTPERLAALGPVAAAIKPANPDDLILISFSSHGYVDTEGVFYLLPYDIGEDTSRQVTPGILSNSVSSDELGLWLDGIDAGEMVMIIDACHAAAAVESKGFKPAPMGSGGLARLAYDKGIRILSATQAVSVAVETGGSIAQGLLTYALLREGLERRAADFKPRDGEVRLKEWLEYGVRRVPRLYEEISAGRIRGVAGGARDVSVERGNDRLFLQQPALFDFHRKPTETTLARSR